MKKEKIKEAYIKYGLEKEDVFKHQHYIIITRSGLEKIQAIEKIHLDYEIIKCEKDFCVIKAYATKGSETVQTFGSALKGDFKNGNTNSWYVVEMSEKRAMSRAILKICGLYELGIFGEDESESFKISNK
tara:strand:+ start:7499 stop:7888 length:390 start_codon:yes stop_codon:yes gene_type:complete